jgi:hypothetical protein
VGVFTILGVLVHCMGIAKLIIIIRVWLNVSPIYHTVLSWLVSAIVSLQTRKGWLRVCQRARCSWLLCC